MQRQAPPLGARRRADECQPSAEPVPCGWFDSSLDLRRGLQVRVHDGPDTLVPLLPTLPLGWWLQWELDASLAATPRPPAA